MYVFLTFQVISSLEEVVECAVVAKNDQLKGAIPFGFIVAKPGMHS